MNLISKSTLRRNNRITLESFLNGIKLPRGVNRVYQRFNNIKGVRYLPTRETSNLIEVTVNGMGQSAPFFAPYAALTAEKGIETICLTLPGHFGDENISSLNFFSQLTIEDYAEYVKRALIEIASQNPEKKLIVNGHSMGGQIVLSAITSLKEDENESETYKKIAGLIISSGAGTSFARIRHTIAMVLSVAAGLPSYLASLGKTFKIPNFVARWSFFAGINIKQFTDIARVFDLYKAEPGRVFMQLLRASFPSILGEIAYKPDLDIGNIPVLNVYAIIDPLVSAKTGLGLSTLLTRKGATVTTLGLMTRNHNYITVPEEAIELVDEKINWLKTMPNIFS